MHDGSPGKTRQNKSEFVRNLKKTGARRRDQKIHMSRARSLRGVLRRFGSIPRLMVSVRGWPYLLADWAGLRRKPYRLRTRRGAVCEIRPGTSDWWIFLEIFLFGIYRRAEPDIRRARVILDIGANVGFFALHASSLNPEAVIHSFEPFPKNVEQMKKNLRLNENRQVHVHPEAVTDQAGILTLYFTPGYDASCSLHGVKEHSCSVTALAVNELFRTCGMDDCDLLKMDCEGSELPIVQAAAPEMLTRVRAIIMEYHSAADVEPLRGALSRAGFRCEILASIHTLYASRG